MKQLKLTPSQNIENFINALEEMIDARDDMWEEEKYSNSNKMLEIKEKRYLPARQLLKQSLEQFVEQIVNTESGIYAHNGQLFYGCQKF